LLIRPKKTLFELYQDEVESNLELLSQDIVDRIGKKNLQMVKCLDCSKKISLEFKYCPYCKKKIDILDYEIKEKKSKKNKKTK
jgi:uncharacterized OB-fold protein